jgi:type IV secretory pathway TrbD component
MSATSWRPIVPTSGRGHNVGRERSAAAEAGTLSGMPAFSTVIWVGFGVFFGFVLWKSGIAMLYSMTQLPPEPLPTGEMRKVSRKYRCDVCGVELKMTMAPDEDPPPPRHCLEDMAEVAPLFD